MTSSLSFVRLCVPSWFILPLASFSFIGRFSLINLLVACCKLKPYEPFPKLGKPVGRKGLQRKSRRPRRGRGLGAKSQVFFGSPKKTRTDFLNLLTVEINHKAHKVTRKQRKNAYYLSFVRLCVPSWFILPLASFSRIRGFSLSTVLYSQIRYHVKLTKQFNLRFPVIR
jgi:hypothetical protein